MKRVKTRILYRNKYVYYVREESAVHKQFYEYRSILPYTVFFDLLGELNKVVYNIQSEQEMFADAGQHNCVVRYREYK